VFADCGGGRDAFGERGFQRVEEGSGEGAANGEWRDGVVHGMSPDIGVTGCWGALNLASKCANRAFYGVILRR
jgi:hypothetical protein